MTSLFLASASPRRRELLAQLGYQFTVIHPDILECQAPGEDAHAYVARLAQQKAQAGLSLTGQADAVVVGADTVVVSQGQVLEKPRDFAHFKAMLEQLSGTTHQVLTGVAVAAAERCRVEVVTTDVQFRDITAAELSTFWATGEPKDKAGGYGIQGWAGRFVMQLSGSYSAVVGLPLYQTEQLLWQFGLHENARSGS